MTDQPMDLSPEELRQETCRLFRETAALCHDELAHIFQGEGATIKAMAIAVQTTRGPVALYHGCGCERCAMQIMAAIGRAFGGEVEITETPAEPGFDLDAIGTVH